MTNIILVDTDARNHLLPLTATRPMGELRVGLCTLREKWEQVLEGQVSYITQEYLQGRYPIHIEADNLLISAGVLPSEAVLRQIRSLGMHEALLSNGELVAARLSEVQIEHLIEDEELKQLSVVELPADIEVQQVSRLWDLTRHNDAQIKADVARLTAGRKSAPISVTNRVLGAENVFLEAGVTLECCIINATEGPVYIGTRSVVMEGSMLRGPIAIGSDVIVKMGAKIYGPTTIGPGSRAGGEITRSILMANSNKGHDGFLGDSVLGEWCNLGADTNTSNLKNNYSEVKLWDYETERFERSGQQFVGLFMGDHAKCGINTMFNTGTVVGVFANVFGAGYPRNFVPDFAWGGADAGYRTYKKTEALDTARLVLARRHRELTDLDTQILEHVYEQTARFRTWEKVER
jgi:UDP-N-acetylglucosamine diphosphorylase/glucosamine-1-phosphate N-acetyltransferase